MLGRFFLLIILFFAQSALANNFVSYFSSIKSEEVNVRKGPNARYSIDWIFRKKGEPVEVIASFEHWLRIRDITGDEGWVRAVMLSKKRSGIIILPQSIKSPTQFVNIYKKAESTSNLIAKIESTQRIWLEHCQKQWCKVKVNNLSGWIEKQYIWGVYANEEF